MPYYITLYAVLLIKVASTIPFGEQIIDIGHLYKDIKDMTACEVTMGGWLYASKCTEIYVIDLQSMTNVSIKSSAP